MKKKLLQNFLRGHPGGRGAEMAAEKCSNKI